MSEEKIKKGIDHTRRNLVASVTGMGLVAPFVAGSRFRLEEPITLRYTGHIPRSHGLYTQGFVPFAELVERETEGRLLLQSFHDRLLHGPIDEPPGWKPSRRRALSKTFQDRIRAYGCLLSAL